MSAGGSPTPTKLHLYGITQDGKLWHAIQTIPQDGSADSWSPWEEVKGKGQSEPGPFVSVDGVSTWMNTNAGGEGGQEELHVLGVTRHGELWHTSRLEGQDWRPFENLSRNIGGNWGTFQQVGVTEIENTLDACVIVKTKQGEQRILHTSRKSNKTVWEKFEDITRPQLAGFPGSFISVDCANLWVEVIPVLHVCGVTTDGKLWHTIRFQDPTWLPFVNVQLLSASGPQHPFANVSLAQGFDTLDVCALANGDLWHTSRFSSDPPHWQAAFDNVSEEAAGKPGPFVSTGCGYVGNPGSGKLHACGLTQDGKLWHTSLISSNPLQWQPFEDITAKIGSPGHFIVVCIANSTPPPAFGGGDPTCARIQMAISNDRYQIQILQRQGASNAISALQRDIANLQNQARQHHCP